MIKFRNYQPRDTGLVGGDKPKAQAAASASSKPAPVATVIAPPPAPSVVLAEKEAAESAELVARAKDVREATRARVIISIGGNVRQARLTHHSIVYDAIV